MKHAISRIVVVSVLTAAVCNATDVSGVWTAAGHPSELVDGAIVIEYDDADNVTALTVAPENGGTVSLSGDAIPFADGAEIRMASAGRLVISNELSGSGMVVLTNTDAAVRIEYDGSLLYTNQWTTMFTGRQLADYAPVKSIRREGSGVYDLGIYYPYNVRRYEDNGVLYMSIQLMASQPTTTRAILMRLRQNGDNIEGIVDRACYYAGRFIHGEDIEKLIERHATNPEYGFVSSYYVQTPDFDHGYGVSHLILEKNTASEVVFAGSAPADLTLAVAPNVAARVDETGVGTGTFTQSFALTGGSATVNGRGDSTEFGSAVHGNGVFSLAETVPSGNDTCSDAYADFIKSAVRVANNRRLSTLTNVTANMSGTYLSGEKHPAVFFPYASNGLCLTGEFHYVASVTTLRFVLMELKQNGQNIYASCFKAGYIQTNDPQSVAGRYSVYDPRLTPYKFDEARSVATATDSGQTGVCDFRFMYSEPGAKMYNLGSIANLMAQETVIRPDQNAYEDVKLRIAGTEARRMLARVTAYMAYPTNGVLEVGPYGEVCAARAGEAGKQVIANDTALVRVLTNGLFRSYANWSVGSYQHVHLIGGTLVSRDDLSTATTDSSCYYNLLTFRDGALAMGVPMRIGFANTASWRVAGSAASTCAANILLSSLNNNTYKTAEFNVTDVTDDDGIDFHLRGNVDALDNTHSNIVLRKTGGGTLAQYGVFASRLAPAPVKIEAGTWLLCGTASPSQAYNLAGGTLATEADSDNSVGGLVVSDSGAIKVAAAASLTFADSAAITWTGAGTVQVDADLTADAVRFGSSADALTSQQLKRLRHGELKVKLDAAGYLRDRIDGTHIIIR